MGEGKVDLDAVADELYGLRPSDFTAARNAHAAAARQAGDRRLAERIGALRRPTLSAWASNLLVRHHPEEVEPLLRLGEALRQAHQDVDGEQLRELSRRQRVLVTALSRQVRELTAEAGHPATDDVLREVEDTLHAVLADPDAAQAWASGRLTRPLAPASGFPPAAGGQAAPRPRAERTSTPATVSDLDEAQRRRRDRQRQEELQRARRDAEDAERELRARQKRCEAAQADVTAAGERSRALERRAAELTAALKRIDDEQRAARGSEHQAADRLREADHAVREARRRAEQAAAHVAHLAGGAEPSREAQR